MDLCKSIYHLISLLILQTKNFTPSHYVCILVPSVWTIEISFHVFLKYLFVNINMGVDVDRIIHISIVFVFHSLIPA